MKHFLTNKCYVELTKESVTSVINSKVNLFGREVQIYVITRVSMFVSFDWLCVQLSTWQTSWDIDNGDNFCVYSALLVG